MKANMAIVLGILVLVGIVAYDVVADRPDGGCGEQGAEAVSYGGGGCSSGGGGAGGGRGMGWQQASAHGTEGSCDTGSCDEATCDDEACEEGSSHESKPGETEMKGRTIVEQGRIVRVDGTLKQSGHEWQLATDKRIYNIHLGPEEYRDARGMILGEGESARVTGFNVDGEIAVCTLETLGREYAFRGEDGRPAWAGGGQGRGWAMNR